MTATTDRTLSLHLQDLRRAIDVFEQRDSDRLAEWGVHMARRLTAGGRLLVAGNGGSAAHAQHLAAEIVGRYADERPPFSALALHTDGSALTALVNDYGSEEMFARQVRAHGHPGDILILMSTSGASPNVIAAARAGRQRNMTVWAVTGPAPNPLQLAACDAVAVEAPRTATVQEVHQVAIHLLCAAFDRAVQDG